MRDIGTIHNNYNGLSIKKEDMFSLDDDIKHGIKYYWSIEEFSKKLYACENWEEIPVYLYDALNRFEDKRVKDD